MKKILMAVVLSVMALNAYAAEWGEAAQINGRFSDLQTLKASDVDVSAAGNPVIAISQEKIINERDLDAITAKAAIKADLYFCVKMASGENLSRGADGFLWLGMGCDMAVEKAARLGVGPEEINEVVQRAIADKLKNSASRDRFDRLFERAAAVCDLYFCVKTAGGENISRGADGSIWQGMGCDKAVEKAVRLGVGPEELNEVAQQAIADKVKDSGSSNRFNDLFERVGR